MPRVLTIGNSFAENATKYLDDIAAASGVHDLIIGKMNLGGCSLEKHWNLVQQCDLLPGVRPYMLQITGRPPAPATLRAALSQHEWDYVTLQQASNLSWQEETFYPWITRLYELIAELAPQAQVVIHQTWAYRCDAPSLKTWGISQEEMFARLKAAYDEAAQKLSCPIIPCGAAFQNARAALKYTPDQAFNFNDPKPLELPDQKNSLIVGYHWVTGNTKSGHAELHMDEKHGNAKGCYLAGAVWFEMFTGHALGPHSFRPEGISAREAAVLQDAAHQAVKAYNGPLT